MKNEIGGYFELGPLRQTGEYYPSALALNTARNALIYLIRAKNIKKILLPRFLCSSVKAACQREAVSVEEYSIGKDWLPQELPEKGENCWLYLVNYYDQLSDEQILSLKEKYPNLILDHVQAFFHRAPDGIDTIYSCRKFFGVPDGAYLCTDARLDEALEIDVSMNRMRHLLGRLEGNCASDYYDDFKNNDALFYEVELREMSQLTHMLLGAIDYEAAKRQREENFRLLDEQLAKKNGLNILTPVGPYAYPFYCENGVQVRKKLAEKRIYVPTLWPNLACEKKSFEQDYSDNILPLPCDHRYDTYDIKRMTTELLNII